MRTIVFYVENGDEARKRVSYLRGIANQSGTDAAAAIYAHAYKGEYLRADEIEFMPDVPEWLKEKIEAGFAEQQARFAVAGKPKKPAAPIDEADFRRAMTANVEKKPPGRPRKYAT